MDSTIISAPTSTKNKEKQSDPDAHSVKKGNAWYFGYKAHVGVDKDSDSFTPWRSQRQMNMMFAQANLILAGSPLWAVV